ncbi:hypothetical protein DMA11_00460 [Marinilabiliaceae bacterium JC017]|nr:hypothetical protein DMA11_00460 [Marinilabiliaceae bacterium JC017]
MDKVYLRLVPSLFSRNKSHFNDMASFLLKSSSEVQFPVIISQLPFSYCFLNIDYYSYWKPFHESINTRYTYIIQLTYEKLSESLFPIIDIQKGLSNQSDSPFRIILM